MRQQNHNEAICGYSSALDQIDEARRNQQQEAAAQDSQEAGRQAERIAELERREAEWRSRYEASVTRTREEADAVRIQVLRQEKANLEAQCAVLRKALKWISKTTLRLIKTPIEEAEPAGAYCQIGRMADNALTSTDAGKGLLAVVEAAITYQHAEKAFESDTGGENQRDMISAQLAFWNAVDAYEERAGQ